MTPAAPPLVVVTRRLPDAWLHSLPDDCRVWIGTDAPGLGAAARAELGEAAAILCTLTERIDEAVLDAAPNLRVVSNMAVGVDNIDVGACTRRSIPVGHTPGVLTAATADLTLALLLSAARRLPEAMADARAGRWTTWSPDGWLGRDLAGATLGVVGLGEIGHAVAQRARAFGMRIVYTSRSARPEAAAVLGARRLTLEELLATADFVTLHVPLAPSTHHLIDASALASMKRTAILINTARGPIVDGEALRHALHDGTIAAAALDVTDPEPLPPTHPLFAAPNLLVAPHIGSATVHTRQRMAALACDNVRAGLRGEPLAHCANPQVRAPAHPSG